MSASPTRKVGRALTGLLLVAVAASGPGCRSTLQASRREAIPKLDAQQRPTAAAFFRSPLIAYPVLSPNGKNFAGVLEQGGFEIVFTRPIAGSQIQTLGKLERTDFKGSLQIRSLGWGNDQRVLVSLESPLLLAVGVRARQSRLMVLDLGGTPPRYLGKKWPNQAYSQFQDDVIAWQVPGTPDHILLNFWKPRDPGVSARLVDVHTGGMQTQAFAKPGTRRWHANHLGQVMAGSGASRTGTEVFTLARSTPDGGFDEIVRFDPFREQGFTFAGFSEKPEQLYVWVRDDRTELHSYDLTKRLLGPVVYADPEYDLGHVRTSRRDGHLLAVYYVTDRPHWKYFDDAAARDQAAIDYELSDTWNEIVSTDAAERVAIVRASSDVSPPRYYIYDRASRRMSLLFEAYPELRRDMMSPMQPVSFAARDGHTLHGYLTRPRGATGAGPAILLVHGGPTDRDVWGWDPEVQYLASRGFSVLQVNFRGSSGYGARHERLGYKQWGLAMQDDLTDAAQWLIAQGVADPARLGIYGASYGGYAALMGLVKTPELFRAGASFAGVTDIIELLDDVDRYAFSDFNGPVTGDASDDREQLAATSPARHVDKIRAPVLIAHGTEDPRVHVNQAHRMIDALEAAGKPVESYLYRDEVHGFMDERNAIDFYTKLADFFERHLSAPPAP